ncbi:SDR family NAD(P)-dependent oxidoreductase [Rhizobium sp. FY34]|uniref:SDR family NAD(P)-dependent oxidoreductase n=1 Tax=Rhizobium sp. FY34 TaxID=2562309 RepID=UPI0010C0FE9E|nr:SDR family NAD(P)-dependent oxidoreductase [Rhizobium sp. FY34]
MRSIIISGASSGIGAALARQLAGPDVRLGLLGRNAERLHAVATDTERRGAICRVGCFDLTDRAGLAAYCASFEAEGPIDVVIGNAGILAGRNGDSGIEDADTAIRVVSTNLCSAIDLAALCAPGMRGRGCGKIVLVSSLAAFSPLADAPAYSAAKAGLVAYGLALRQALAPDGINVVVSCPGYVETPMGAIHMGSRPMEVSAQDAARRIIDAMERNKAVSGFPFPLYWSARLSQLAPEWIRRIATGGLRFHVRRHD